MMVLIWNKLKKESHEHIFFIILTTLNSQSQIIRDKKIKVALYSEFGYFRFNACKYKSTIKL